jgi:hypothetical protein
MWRKNWRKKARRVRKVTERKMGNKHLLEAGKAIYVKAGKMRKVAERKMGNMHLLEACKVMHVNAGMARKVTERKICNTHLLEPGRLYLNARKRAEKGRAGEESGGKKDGQYAFIRSRQG